MQCSKNFMSTSDKLPRYFVVPKWWDISKFNPCIYKFISNFKWQNKIDKRTSLICVTLRNIQFDFVNKGWTHIRSLMTETATLVKLSETHACSVNVKCPCRGKRFWKISQCSHICNSSLKIVLVTLTVQSI